MAEDMVTASSTLDRVLVLEMVRVTEAAAVAASKLIGRGDEKAADHAAVEAMRAALNTLEMDGTVVIGEGERDEAPMLLYRREGRSRRAPGRRSTSRSTRWKAPPSPPRPGRTRWLCSPSPRRRLLNAPDVYMDKLAWGRGYPQGVIDLTKSPSEIPPQWPAAKGVRPFRDHRLRARTGRVMQKLIAELRSRSGCGIMLIPGRPTSQA
jgi:fructose-1,6-bisphosphatase II / sedoheptulose-1,7-bisphosphatase